MVSDAWRCFQCRHRLWIKCCLHIVFGTLWWVLYSYYEHYVRMHTEFSCIAHSHQPCTGLQCRCRCIYIWLFVINSHDWAECTLPTLNCHQWIEWIHSQCNWILDALHCRCLFQRNSRESFKANAVIVEFYIKIKYTRSRSAFNWYSYFRVGRKGSNLPITISSLNLREE